MIIERDIGRLAKYTFDMGGTGDLLSLSLNVPPWDDLHELSPQELHLIGLVTPDTIADHLRLVSATSAEVVVACITQNPTGSRRKDHNSRHCNPELLQSNSYPLT